MNGLAMLYVTLTVPLMILFLLLLLLIIFVILLYVKNRCFPHHTNNNSNSHHSWSIQSIRETLKKCFSPNRRSSASQPTNSNADETNTAQHRSLQAPLLSDDEENLSTTQWHQETYDDNYNNNNDSMSLLVNNDSRSQDINDSFKSYQPPPKTQEANTQKNVKIISKKTKTRKSEKKNDTVREAILIDITSETNNEYIPPVISMNNTTHNHENNNNSDETNHSNSAMTTIIDVRNDDNMMITPIIGATTTRTMTTISIAETTSVATVATPPPTLSLFIEPKIQPLVLSSSKMSLSVVGSSPPQQQPQQQQLYSHSPTREKMLMFEQMIQQANHTSPTNNHRSHRSHSTINVGRRSSTITTTTTTVVSPSSSTTPTSTVTPTTPNTPNTPTTTQNAASLMMNHHQRRLSSTSHNGGGHMTQQRDRSLSSPSSSLPSSISSPFAVSPSSPSSPSSPVLNSNRRLSLRVMTPQYTEQELETLQVQLQSWIESRIVNYQSDNNHQALQFQSNLSFYQNLASGVILCQLVNEIGQKTENQTEGNLLISTRKIQYKVRSIFQSNANVELFLDACVKLGIPKYCLFSAQDLNQEKNKSMIVGCLEKLRELS